MVIHYAEPVRNEVLYVNPLIVKHPFDFVRGKHSPLGVFSMPGSDRRSGSVRLFSLDNLPDEIEIKPPFSRTSYLDEIHQIEDRFGNHYRRVSLKGAGVVYDKSVRNYPPMEISGALREYLEKISRSGRVYNIRSELKQLGVLPLESANLERKHSQAFLKAGIRTTPTLAIIRLLEYPVANGSQRTYRHLKKKLALAIRAYGALGRVWDAVDPKMIEEAIDAVKNEFRIKELSKEEYSTWFAFTLAKQVALMHNNGWTHGMLHVGNVTLDARITDLVTLAGIGKRTHANREQYEERRDGDIRNAIGSIAWLKAKINPDIKSEEFDRIGNFFMGVYSSIYRPPNLPFTPSKSKRK
ncbi:MAG: hypothetical protein V1835_05275 [Candidatus Micrarchaeota archaeon]